MSPGSSALVRRGVDARGVAASLLATPGRVAALLLLVFASLVGAGLTGSSLQMYLTQEGMIESDPTLLLGKNRLIRADEWLVITRMAIGQSAHRPRFPVVNNNLGPDGHNMLVVGMSGVPVAHVSAIARPATWGFFVFDLRRALAWYWWLPPFGCLFAVWAAMSVLLPGRWIIGLATAALFTGSGYVVAWSNWPAYAVLFPALAFWLFFRIFDTQRRWHLLALASALGLSVAGFVFVLYPPWQITLGYLFLFLSTAVVLRNRTWQRLTAARGLALVLAATLSICLVWAWWSDARTAIDAMQATLYPGRRTTIAGGGMDLWMSFRGFLNAHSLYYEDGALNQSESSSFYYFFPVVILAAAVAAARNIRPTGIQLALMLFCGLALWFQLVGVGETLAEWSLWGRVVPARADLALGLASILLCSISVASARQQCALKARESIVIALVWAAIVVGVVVNVPAVAVGQPGGWTWLPLLLLPTVFALSCWLLAGNEKAYLAGLLVVTLATTTPFNPLVRAPTGVFPAGTVLKNAAASGERVLVVGYLTTAMALLAAGVPVANGIFYYPQQTLWHSLDPAAAFATIWNRYQHLAYAPAAAGDGVMGYRIEKKGDDAVRVSFDPGRFNFARAHAALVIAPVGIDFLANPYLQPLASVADKSIYRVHPRGDRLD